MKCVQAIREESKKPHRKQEAKMGFFVVDEIVAVAGVTWTWALMQKAEIPAKWVFKLMPSFEKYLGALHCTTNLCAEISDTLATCVCCVIDSTMLLRDKLLDTSDKHTLRKRCRCFYLLLR